MARVIIPFPYRKYTDNEREIVIDAPDLEGTMKRLVQMHEGLNVLFEQPKLLSIFVNGRLVKVQQKDWSQISLKQDDEISLIIPIAGG